MDAEDHLVSRFNLYKGKYCLFAGSGISVCAGVPLATIDLLDLPSIVTHIQKDFHASLGHPPVKEEDLLAWYADQKLLQEPETLYSDALNLIGDTPRSRQHYLRHFFDGKGPGSCHNSLAKLVEREFIQILLTTNFDSLIEDAIRGNGHCLTPKVAAHTDNIVDILLTEPGPKVAKLHGDYLFSDIRNTEEETRTLTENMRNKLRAILAERGLIVIGYSGSDNSIMSVFEQMTYDEGFFPYGLYWCYLDTHPPRPRVESLVEKAGGKLLPILSAESILDGLCRRL